MSSIATALSRFRDEPGPSGERTNSPFRLRSTLSPPATAEEIEVAWRGVELPPAAVDLWTTYRTARLFEDIDYGQWGLIILDPGASVERTSQERESRPMDVRSDDIVIGVFLGDQDLLVLAPSNEGNQRVMIALPLDGRADWMGAAPALGEFLEAYFAAGGNKFWERAARH
jgi:hypothetical protein